MSAKNKEIVKKVNASFAEGGVEGFLTHCADDVVWTMVGNKTTKERKPFANGWLRWIPSRPNLRSITS